MSLCFGFAASVARRSSTQPGTQGFRGAVADSTSGIRRFDRYLWVVGFGGAFGRPAAGRRRAERRVKCVLLIGPRPPSSLPQESPEACSAQDREPRRPRTRGVHPIFWLCGCGAASPPIEEVGPAPVFEAAFDGEHGVGSRFRPTAPRSFEPTPDDAIAGAFH